jgi:hypothetical protein
MSRPAAFYADAGVECHGPAGPGSGVPDMKSVHARLQALLAATAILLLLPTSRAEPLPEADEREVRSYTLTEAALDKYVQATRALSRVPLACESESPGVKSLSDAAAKIDAVPGARAAVQSAGMTSREYVLFAFSLIENAFASYDLDRLGGRLPPGISMANVDFLRTHQAKIQALAAETGAAECVESGNGAGGR